MMNKQRIFGAVLLFSVATSWGGTYVATKFIMSSIPVFSLMLGRYVVAFIPLALICRFRGERLPGWGDIKLITPPALVGYFLSIALQFWGTELCGASVASLINVSSALFAPLLSVSMLGERLTGRKLIAGAVGFLGVMLVIGFSSDAGAGFLGGGVMIACALTWALMTIMFKRISSECSSLLATTCAIGIALVGCLPFSVWEMARDGAFFFNDRNVVLSVLYIGLVATAYAFFAWNKGMTMMDVGSGILFINFQPLVAAVLGWLFMAEKLNWSFIVGGALLFLAIALSFQAPAAPANSSGSQPTSTP